LSPSGQCIIQTSKPDFDADELLAMVRKEGLNNILLYANWFSKLLEVARTNLNALRSVQQIAYTGEALNPDDARWVVEQGIPVTVSFIAAISSDKLIYLDIEGNLCYDRDRYHDCLISFDNTS
jgi:hypothetical protein